MTATKVHLRAMEPEDLDLLYHIENDSDLWEVGSSNVPYSRYALHDYIAHASSDIYTDGQVRLIIETVEQKQVVGVADVVNFDARHQRAELGLVVLRQHRHHGFATDALKQLELYALRVLHLHQLYAVIATSNESSLGLFRHAGYEASARLRQWLYDGRDYHDAVVVQKLL